MVSSTPAKKKLKISITSAVFAQSLRRSPVPLSRPPFSMSSVLVLATGQFKSPVIDDALMYSFMFAYIFTEKMAMTECIRGLCKLFVEQLNINLQRQRKDQRRFQRRLQRRRQRRRLQSATQSLSNENENTLTLPSTART